MKEEDLTTDTGYLRYKSWTMRMSFEEKCGGTAALRAFQTYAQRVEMKYGKKAFKLFAKADMQVLKEKWYLQVTSALKFSPRTE